MVIYLFPFNIMMWPVCVCVFSVNKTIKYVMYVMRDMLAWLDQYLTRIERQTKASNILKIVHNQKIFHLQASSNMPAKTFYPFFHFNVSTILFYFETYSVRIAIWDVYKNDKVNNYLGKWTSKSDVTMLCPVLLVF